MKQVLLLFSALMLSYSLMAGKTVTIAQRASIELTYKEFAQYDVKLINKSGQAIEVAVYEPGNTRKLKGFGLAPRGRATLSIAENQLLRLTNTSAKEVTVQLEFVEKQQISARADGEYITFSLHNTSLKSIPLQIPGVMNPNLSPMSSSGVSLRKGQKIYYKKGVRKILILEVDATIQEGDKIDVARLIRAVQ